MKLEPDQQLSTIRRALAEAGQPEELAEQLCAISEHETLGMEHLLQWIHVARGELSAERLREYIRKIKEVEAELLRRAAAELGGTTS